ncbi:response regulator transcription factor [uncultured Jatrophihabitans sp.]|uniref:helix-turn-helix transcriptional regulator n=1 Tax=uncultured Jatrophihabitans sp. TaxID=1610747 RepID=UPI0035CB206E
MTTTYRRPLAERLDAATAHCADLESLSRAVFDTVARDISFAFACLASTDPATELIARAFKSHPLAIGEEGFAAAEYGGPDVNQFAELVRRPVPVGALSHDTGGHPDSCRRMREFMTPRFGFTDELRLACRARDTTWAVLALYRGPGEDAFTPRDAEVLGAVHETIAVAVQRTLFTGPAASPGAGGAAVLIVDADDRLTDATAAAREQIEELAAWDEGVLPTSVTAVAAQARSTAQPATTRVLSRTGRWLALRAMPLDATSSGAGSDRRSVVVTVDAAPAAAVGELALAARGLTAREQDVTRLVLQGASTKDIAAALHLSQHTVQDHLKSVFTKLQVNSRREMIARLVL